MAGYIGNKSSVTLVDGYTEAEADAEFVNDPNDAITVSGSNVGIGTSSITNESDHHKLKIAGASGSGAGIIEFADTSNNIDGAIFADGGNLFIVADRDNATADSSIRFRVDGSSESMRITSSGNVGVGTSSPSADFVVSNGGAAGIELQPEITTDTNRITNYDRAASAYMNFRLDALTHQFLTSGSERMRLDASGNLNIGRTSTGAASDGTGGSGINITQTGAIEMARNGSPALFVNRTTSDGTIIDLRKNGTSVGAIGKSSAGFYVAGESGSDFGVVFDGGGLLPSNGNGSLRDNSDNLGHPSYRWEDAFITNGATTGSDANDKQDIATLTNTEMLVAARLSQTFRTYRWKDAVVSKGDSARTHTGTIAQEVQSAFTAEGLNAGDYAMFMSDTWWEHDVDVPAVEAVDEVLDEDGNVTTEAVEAKDAYTRTDTYDTEDEAPEGATSKTRMGIRYPELLSFVAAYNEQRFASIEARLTALEA